MVTKDIQDQDLVLCADCYHLLNEGGLAMIFGGSAMRGSNFNFNQFGLFNNEDSYEIFSPGYHTDVGSQY